MTEKKEEVSFEDSFRRLEEILEKLHGEAAGLDESLALYEEADRLIVSCSKKLSSAEQKIEILIKQRNGELTLGEDQKPTTQPFSTQT